MDDIQIYYYLITTLVYTFMIIAVIGIIWGFLLAIGKTRAIIIQSMKTKYKPLFWFMNFTFWTVPIALVAGFYFFTIWYVMNPQAQIYWFPYTN